MDEGMKSPEARMLTSFLRRRGDLGFCILEYPLDIFLDTGLCRRHRSLLTMSQLLSRIDAVCFEGVEELSRGFGGRIVRSNTAGDVVCDALEPPLGRSPLQASTSPSSSGTDCSPRA